MTNFLRIFVQFIFKTLAKIYILGNKPFIIVISGTTNRFWAKEEISRVLKEKNIPSRGNFKNFNAEIGLPLSILGLFSGEGNFYNWLKVLKKAFKKIIKIGKEREFLVLEMAISEPNDMDYLLSIAIPDIVIFTTITMIYAENFENLEQIAKEYKKLAQSVANKNGLLIINNDDERIRKIGEAASSSKITYGIKENADYHAKSIKKVIDGQQFLLDDELVKINRFGEHHIYSSLIGKIIKNYIKT